MCFVISGCGALEWMMYGDAGRPYNGPPANQCKNGDLAPLSSMKTIDKKFMGKDGWETIPYIQWTCPDGEIIEYPL